MPHMVVCIDALVVPVVPAMEAGGVRVATRAVAQGTDTSIVRAVYVGLDCVLCKCIKEFLNLCFLCHTQTEY